MIIINMIKINTNMYFLSCLEICDAIEKKGINQLKPTSLLRNRKKSIEGVTCRILLSETWRYLWKNKEISKLSIGVWAGSCEFDIRKTPLDHV